jgi:hypothetical protein
MKNGSNLGAMTTRPFSSMYPARPLTTTLNRADELLGSFAQIVGWTGLHGVAGLIPGRAAKIMQRENLLSTATS